MVDDREEKVEEIYSEEFLDAIHLYVESVKYEENKRLLAMNVQADFDLARKRRQEAENSIHSLMKEKHLRDMAIVMGNGEVLNFHDGGNWLSVNQMPLISLKK